VQLFLLFVETFWQACSHRGQSGPFETIDTDTMKDAFFTFSGALARRGSLETVRTDYARFHRDIETGAQVRSCLRAGEHAWPGGYRCFFVTSDGAALSFAAVRAELESVTWSIRNDVDDGWRVVRLACENETDSPIFCDHTGEQLAGEE
jgi:hypothetical protein